MRAPLKGFRRESLWVALALDIAAFAGWVQTIMWAWPEAMGPSGSPRKIAGCIVLQLFWIGLIAWNWRRLPREIAIALAEVDEITAREARDRREEVAALGRKHP